jgi:hypothetical protein
MSETPGATLQRLLNHHPELRSSFAQAHQDYQLVGHMEDVVAERSREALVARDALEGERHRLDPRRRRQLRFGVGLSVAAAAVLVAAVALALQLRPAHLAHLVPLAVVGAAAGGGIAWRAGIARREAATTALVMSVTGASLGVLLGLWIHAEAALNGGQPAWRAIGVAALLALVLGATLVVVAGVAARLEPLAVARLRLRVARAQDAFERAHALLLEDRQRARMESGRFLGLLRAELAPDLDDDTRARVIELAERRLPEDELTTAQLAPAPQRTAT